MNCIRLQQLSLPIVYFPNFFNILPAPANGLYVSQLVRYARACCKYQDFVDRGKLLISKLLAHGYRRAKLLSTVKRLFGKHHDFVDPFNVAVSKLLFDLMASVEA